MSGQPYELSEQAVEDLEEIYDHTLNAYGETQAVAYLLAFDELFHTLAVTSEMGRARPEVRSGLRSMVQGSHVVFYRVVAKKVRVIRVLHGARDLPSVMEK